MKTCIPFTCPAVPHKSNNGRLATLRSILRPLLGKASSQVCIGFCGGGRVGGGGDNSGDSRNSIMMISDDSDDVAAMLRSSHSRRRLHRDE